MRRNDKDWLNYTKKKRVIEKWSKMEFLKYLIRRNNCSTYKFKNASFKTVLNAMLL